MIYVFLSILIIGYIAWLFGSVLLIAEAEDLKWQIVGGISLILSLAVLIWVYDKYNSNDQPCAIYKTRLEYNPAIKNIMPMKYCAERVS